VCHEKDISAQQSQAQKDARVPGADEHKERSQCVEKKKDERKKEADRLKNLDSWEDG
jgi:hypothetical protein